MISAAILKNRIQLLTILDLISTRPIPILTFLKVTILLDRHPILNSFTIIQHI